MTRAFACILIAYLVGWIPVLLGWELLPLPVRKAAAAKLPELQPYILATLMSITARAHWRSARLPRRSPASRSATPSAIQQTE